MNAEVNTPHIDQVLSSYHERSDKPEDSNPSHVQTRLLVIEQQLASLLKRSEEVYNTLFVNNISCHVMIQGLTPARTAAVQKYVVVLSW